MTSPSPPAFELSVANGILVTPRGRRRANLYVRDGKVALITDQLLPVAERVDAKNLFVVPGMIDTHVHFMDPGASERGLPFGNGCGCESWSDHRYRTLSRISSSESGPTGGEGSIPGDALSR